MQPVLRLGCHHRAFRAAVSFRAIPCCMLALGVCPVSLQGDTLVYSNTLGRTAVAYGAGVTIADDLIVAGTAGCQLAGFAFDVDGNADGAGEGPFAVDFELFDNCPGIGGAPIPGTKGHVDFPHPLRYSVEFQVPPTTTVTIPRTVWLSVTLNRDHAGWVGGAPALRGYSDDWFYHGIYGCGFSFGGYPLAAHGSMNARLSVRGQCPVVHAAYHVKTPRRGSYSPGGEVRMADDIAIDGACRMNAYEVSVRGSGVYAMDLRENGPGGLPAQTIPGTARAVQSFGGFIKTLREEFHPPIELPPNFWFSIAADSSVGRTMVAGLPARIGNSQLGFAILGDTAWELRPFPDEFAWGALEVTILCEGEAPTGACCDMQFLDDHGEAVCREVPKANCPYPAPGSSLVPAWQAGTTCGADAFNPPCGASACCRADGNCTNLSANECAPRGVSWTKGVYCGAPEITCPPMCVLSDEPCTTAHASVGCIDPFCCAAVCAVPGQDFCCFVEWDSACVRQAAEMCGIPPPNDECFSEVNGEGARLIGPTGNFDADVLNATENDQDPGFCCHLDEPGGRGLGTVWFRFVASSSTARIRTCLSNAPALDSLIQVFEAADSSSPLAACATLRSIGCSDDASNCSSGNHNSLLCLRNLTVGRTYYIMVAGKTQEARGIYTLSLGTSCNDAVQPGCDCPSGPVTWLDPPSGIVDARRPHPRSDPLMLEGISQFRATAPLGSDRLSCWSVCETLQSPSHGSNAIKSVSAMGGQYIISLQRPITPGAATTLMLNGQPNTAGVFSFHPANINGDSAATPADLLFLVDTLNRIRFLPWDMLSGDIDHSGVMGPADLIETIDLLNGIPQFTNWNGSPRPDPSPCLTPP